MQKITTFLWFDDKVEEAAKYYVSIFKKSKLRAVSRYGESAAKASGRPAGSAMTVEFELDGPVRFHFPAPPIEESLGVPRI